MHRMCDRLIISQYLYQIVVLSSRDFDPEEDDFSRQISRLIQSKIQFLSFSLHLVGINFFQIEEQSLSIKLSSIDMIKLCHNNNTVAFEGKEKAFICVIVNHNELPCSRMPT